MGSRIGDRAWRLGRVGYERPGFAFLLNSPSLIAILPLVG